MIDTSIVGDIVKIAQEFVSKYQLELFSIGLVVLVVYWVIIHAINNREEIKT